jgi:hypothetical protein
MCTNESEKDGIDSKRANIERKGDLLHEGQRDICRVARRTVPWFTSKRESLRIIRASCRDDMKDYNSALCSTFNTEGVYE